MIVIKLPPVPGIHLPAEPAPARQPQQQQQQQQQDDEGAATSLRSNLRSRSNSLTADEQSRSASSSRRSTPRANSAAFARNQPSQQFPSRPVDPTTGVELDYRQEDPRALKYDVPLDIAMPAFGRQTKDLERDLGRLYEAVAGARRIAVICGAGISVSSPANIPDFRSANGLFKKLKEQHPAAGLSSGKDLFDARLFSSESTSALFYTMIAELKSLADQAQPTIFHRFLKRLDQEGRLQRVYTQNIDGLEQKAGLTFGLGETGDSTSTVRALGKRKRQGAAAGWSRSQSDSALLQSRQHGDAAHGEPMFPRTIPLHGTLQTLTCALCSHKVTMGDTTRPDDGPPRSTIEPIKVFTPRETLEALEVLKDGEAVLCPKCTTIDETRQACNLRSRGVGRMKTDVVLYGGQNEGAERVGECLQRDILGLRDPFETPVPESVGEIRARERKEKREEEKRTKEAQAQALRVKAEAAADPIKAEAAEDAALVETKLGGGNGHVGGESICDVSMDKDDILARAFKEEDDEEEQGKADQKPGGLATIAEDTSVTFAEPSTKPVRPQRVQRAARLKPLPPDLLIVAGTSLKVPGTKRIVREFAKACHARDARVYYTESDEDDDEAEAEASGNESRSKGRRGTRSRSGSADEEGASVRKGGRGSDEEEDGEEEEEDPNAPIRTILLNYDFPVPSREWEDVFDVWVQGDLQRAALGVFPPREVKDEAEEAQQAIESVRSQYSWQELKMALEGQRMLSKKKGRRAMSGRGAASMSRSVSRDQDDDGEGDDEVLNMAPRKFPSVRASGGAWGRSKSESVIKRHRAVEKVEDLAKRSAALKGRGGGGGKGMSRASSKKGAAALAAASSTNGSKGSGKGRGGVGQKGAFGSTTATDELAAAADGDSSGRKQHVSGVVVVMSSVAPPTPPPSTPSADSTPEPAEAALDVHWQQRKRSCSLKSLLGPYVKAGAAAADGAVADGQPAVVARRTMTRTRSRAAEVQAE